MYSPVHIFKTSGGRTQSSTSLNVYIVHNHDPFF